MDAFSNSFSFKVRTEYYNVIPTNTINIRNVFEGMSEHMTCVSPSPRRVRWKNNNKKKDSSQVSPILCPWSIDVQLVLETDRKTKMKCLCFVVYF